MVQKEKRLDYKSTYKGSEIHIETKGTTSKNKVKTMIQDIHAKKVGKIVLIINMDLLLYLMA